MLNIKSHIALTHKEEELHPMTCMQLLNTIIYLFFTHKATAVVIKYGWDCRLPGTEKNL
jgi:hypothetical protein